MTFEESLDKYYLTTEKWFNEHDLVGRVGYVIHTVFFKTEKSANDAVEILSPLGYNVHYKDTLDDDFPFWLNLAQEIVVDRQSVESSVNQLLAAPQRSTFRLQ